MVTSASTTESGSQKKQGNDEAEMGSARNAVAATECKTLMARILLRLTAACCGEAGWL